MARPRTALAAWTQYLAARAAVAGLTSFGVGFNLRAAAALGRMLCRLDQRHRQRARESIRWAYPGMDAQAVDTLASRSFEHFLQLMVEVCSSPRLMHPDGWHRYVRLGDVQPVLELLNAGRPVIMVTGHLGNWEILGTVLALLGYPVAAVARPIDNPLINDWLLGIREQRGLRVITKWQATESMTQVLDDGGALAFIADQNAGDRGMFVPFFGRLASTHKSIALLAMTREAPIICGGALRVGADLRYELTAVDVIRPEDWASQPDPAFYITARYIRAIETMVRRSPHQYMWMHRRWKSRPRFEREGRPMPAALRRNLESLPWMDQATLDRISQSTSAA